MKNRKIHLKNLLFYSKYSIGNIHVENVYEIFSLFCLKFEKRNKNLIFTSLFGKGFNSSGMDVRIFIQILL